MLPTPLLVPADLRSLLPSRAADAPAAVLARMADRFGRSFAIHSPFAPGLCCVGGEVELEAEAAAANEAPRVSATGNGRTPSAAAISCLGEAADQISEFERPQDVVRHAAAHECAEAVTSGWIADLLAPRRAGIDWVAAVDAGSGRRVLLPADLCVRRERRRRAIEPAGPLSSGVAAGPSVADASLRAILELCERDALALWWIGGRRGRAFRAGHPASRAGLDLTQSLRDGQTGRVTSLLDISGDLGIPVVAAISTDPDGRGLACGAAARLDPAEAAKAAVLEMCQMEMSAPVAAAKRAERGDGALNEADRRHLRRAAFASADCDLLVPLGSSTLADAAPGVSDPLADLVERLSRNRIAVFLVDLTRPDVGVPVMRALAPCLQPFTRDVTTERLAKAKAEPGAGRADVDLALF